MATAREATTGRRTRRQQNDLIRTRKRFEICLPIANLDTATWEMNKISIKHRVVDKRRSNNLSPIGLSSL